MAAKEKIFVIMTLLYWIGLVFLADHAEPAGVAILWIILGASCVWMVKCSKK